MLANFAWSELRVIRERFTWIMRAHSVSTRDRILHVIHSQMTRKALANDTHSRAARENLFFRRKFCHQNHYKMHQILMKSIKSWSNLSNLEKSIKFLSPYAPEHTDLLEKSSRKLLAKPPGKFAWILRVICERNTWNTRAHSVSTRARVFHVFLSQIPRKIHARKFTRWFCEMDLLTVSFKRFGKRWRHPCCTGTMCF